MRLSVNSYSQQKTKDPTPINSKHDTTFSRKETFGNYDQDRTPIAGNSFFKSEYPHENAPYNQEQTLISMQCIAKDQIKEKFLQRNIYKSRTKAKFIDPNKLNCNINKDKENCQNSIDKEKEKKLKANIVSKPIRKKL